MLSQLPSFLTISASLLKELADVDSLESSELFISIWLGSSTCWLVALGDLFPDSDSPEREKKAEKEVSGLKALTMTSILSN